MSSMERFTQRARRVLSLAHEEAERMRHTHIGTEHLLLGLMLEDGGIAGRVLRELGLEFDRVRDLIERMVGLGEYTTQRPTLSPGTQKVLELAVDQARELGHHYIGVEHLLLGIIALEEGIALDALRQLGVTPEQVRRQTHRILKESKSAQRERSQQRRRKGKEAEGKGKSKSKTPLVDQLATDLTQMAEDGKLDPVIGRQMEIERVVQILARRTKNNPALTGEPGVGKTAIVEGLAQRILEGDVPIPLLGKRLLQLDVGSLVAGTMYRGQFEDRLKRVIQELKSSDSVLFIDEVHMLVGAGSAGSAMDAANILKPALSRGELQVIGATTLDEYRKHIESDAALERRFQSVKVEPPSTEDAIDILKGLRPRYEDHHKMNLTDDAVAAAVKLSDRYITGRFLPDKAIDIMDEAGARARIKAMTRPPEVKNLEAAIEETRAKKEQAIKDQKFEEAASMRDEEKKAKETLESTLDEWKKNNEDARVEVGEDDIMHVVAKWTGIPLKRMEQGDVQKLLSMEKEISKIVIGQSLAVETLCKALRRSRADLKDPARPIGAFMMLGPTGVGKTLLAKSLAVNMFGDSKSLVQLDMSEYMEKFNVSRLVGSPPGYVGYEEGGQLTEKVRRNPYSVVLFDEVEKAHPDVMNMLLQILEEGKLTDSFGRQVDFRNTIILLTSNVGAERLKKGATMGFTAPDDEQDYERMKENLTEEAKKVFRPEFLNRFDDIVVFRSLGREDLTQILDLELAKVENRLAQRDIHFELDEAARDLLLDKGHDPTYGARPMRRAVEKYLEDPMAEEIIRGDLREGETIGISAKDDQLVFTQKKAEAKGDDAKVSG